MTRKTLISFVVLVMLASAVLGGLAQAQEQSEFGLPYRIHFSYDWQLASSVFWRLVPADKAIDTPTGPIPEYTQVYFQNFREGVGWQDNGMYLYLYPTVTFPADPNAPFTKALQNLRGLLPARPTLPSGNIPMLPIVTASQMLRAHVQYLDFQTGLGVRYLTAATLDVSPLSNETLFYTYQGLTADGAYYVAAMFPVKAASLPDSAPAMDAAAYETFAANYEQYLSDTTHMLNALTPSDFSPNLALLDGIIQSLNVQSPTATLVTPEGSGIAQVTFENINFRYDDTLASRLEVDAIPPVDDPTGQTMFGSEPGYTRFLFYDYLAQNLIIQPQLRVFPVSSFAGTDTVSDRVLAELQSFLAAHAPLAAGTNLQGTPQTLIPALPPVNALQVFITKPECLDFQNGSGVRFITHYAQDAQMVTNAMIFYTYQGLTANGQYVVSASFPVSATVLPDTFDYTGFNYEDFFATYPDYLSETVAALDALQAGDFSPTLTQLDDLIRSLNVGRNDRLNLVPNPAHL